MAQLRAALGALKRCTLRMAAVVAHHTVIDAVVGQIDTAAAALGHVAAVGTQQLTAAAAAV